MRPFISTLAACMAFGLLLGTFGASAALVSAQKNPVLVVPDANRTKAFFIEIVSAGGSFTIPKLNGLTGTITYYSIQPDVKAKVYTAWGTYGSPPPPSQGGSLVAYVVVHLTTPPAEFANGYTPKSTITYARLIPSKTYYIDLFDCTANREVTRYSAGSPLNNTLTLFSPLQGENFYVNETICIELVQNP